MLVRQVRYGESIQIGESVIHVEEPPKGGRKVKLAIDAPPHVKVHQPPRGKGETGRKTA